MKSCSVFFCFTFLPSRTRPPLLTTFTSVFEVFYGKLMLGLFLCLSFVIDLASFDLFYSFLSFSFAYLICGRDELFAIFCFVGVS
jgi:hypothetical protein